MIVYCLRIICFLVCIALFQTGATAQVPNGVQLQVVGVAYNDVLNIRARPTSRAPIVAVIPPNASGIISLGRYSGSWIYIDFNGARGWVSRRYVTSVASWHRQAPEQHSSDSQRLAGTFSCVLGSYQIHANAAKGLNRARYVLPHRIDPRRLQIVSGQVSGRSGYWYRVVIDGFFDRHSAMDICHHYSRQHFFSSFIVANY